MSRFFPDILRSTIAIGIACLAYLTLESPENLTPLVPQAFLGLLTIGLIWALFKYRQPYAWASEALHEATQELKARQSADNQARMEDRDPNPQDKEAETTLPTADDQADLRPKAFAKHQPLLASWQEFHTSRRGTRLSRPTTGRATVSPHEYFTVAKLLGRNSVALPNALPGAFTAVGLLGTFVGIAMGLADIELTAVVDDTSTTNDITAGVRTLMGGMSTAFVTSIVGITWSLWWLFEFRSVEHKLKYHLDLFIAETVRIFRVEEPHQTLVRVAGANESVQHIAVAIRSTAEEIKGNVQSLGQDLAEALDPYFEKHIGKPIRNLNIDLGARQTEALGRMVEAFRDTLVSSVKEELSAFGQALRVASDHQTNATRQLEDFFKRLMEVSDIQIRLLARTTDVATVFDHGLAAMSTATEAIDAAGKSARTTMESARRAIGMARGFTEESRRQLEVQEEVSKAAHRSWDAQTSLLEEMQANFGRLATDLGDKIMEFQTVSAQKISEVFHVFDSEMAKVVDHLGGTLAELRDVTEELPEGIDSLRETTQELVGAARDQRDSVEKGLQAFEEAKIKLAGELEQAQVELRELGRALPAFANDFGLHQTENAKAMDNLQRGIEAVVDRMEAAGARSERDSKRLTDTMEDGTGRIAEMASLVVGSVGLVGDWTAKATEHLALLSERTDALTKASSDLQMALNQLPSRLETGPAVTQVPVPPTPMMPTQASEDPDRPEVPGPPTTERTDDMMRMPRNGVGTGPGRDGEHSVGPTEPRRGFWGRLFGRGR